MAKLPHPVTAQIVWSCSIRHNTSTYPSDQRRTDCTLSSSLNYDRHQMPLLNNTKMRTFIPVVDVSRVFHVLDATKLVTKT